MRVILAALSLVACGKPAADTAAQADFRAQETTEASVSPEPTSRNSAAIEDIVWRRTDAGAAPGSIVMFASGGSMVMTSCVETYRIARWRAVDGDTIAWNEDGMPIEADFAIDATGALMLSLDIVGGAVEQLFSRVDGDALCPPK